MRFDTASAVEETTWNMRIADEPRAADRAVILRLFNGAAPFDEATAEENQIQVNRNDLSGPNLMANAFRQWNQNFLKGSRFFTARPDTGPAHKRQAWSSTFTTHANRLLKRAPAMRGQARGTGKNTLLYGIGPTMWKNRRGIVPGTIPVGSLMIPSETEIEDFEDSLPYFAVFKEWNLAQLYDMTKGPRRDPGWNMDLVQAQYEYLKDELRKSPNSLAYQYMPERIEELAKQDKGLFGSDAAPTVDVWDFYFRETEDGNGWYRRIILDWGGGVEANKVRPASKNKVKDSDAFLYTSGKRKYADHLSEVLHCQFGDCSPYAPSKYHSLRGLGWMLWGVCDIQNQQWCKFNEAVFEQYMWFFQTAGNQDLLRLKKANFQHMGVIPQGIRFLLPNERFIPNMELVQLAFELNRQRMSEASTSYTQDFQKQQKKEMTATETMAIVNAAQSLSSSIFDNAALEEESKYREMCRRLCLKNNNDPMAREFRLSCLKDGIDEDMLDVDKWTIEAERVMGGGNKTVQMATVQFLQNIRKNLPPDGQRLVDNMSIAAATDQPQLADDMAPLKENQPISSSMHDAQLATERLLKGLPFHLPKDAIGMDYAVQWLHDLALLVQQAVQSGGMAQPDQLVGMGNLAQHIKALLDQEATNPDQKENVRPLEDNLGQLMNHLKAFQQRLMQAAKAQQKQAGNGANGEGAAKVQAMMMQAQAKAANTRESHAQKTAQRQQAWEMEQQRKNAQLAADIQREGVRTRHELLGNRIRALSEN